MNCGRCLSSPCLYSNPEEQTYQHELWLQTAGTEQRASMGLLQCLNNNLSQKIPTSRSQFISFYNKQTLEGLLNNK